MLSTVRFEFEQAAAKCKHDRFPRPDDSSIIKRPVDWGLTFLFSRDQLRVNALDDVAQLQEVGACDVTAMYSYKTSQ